MSPAPNRQFASDNWAGICPEAWAALEAAKSGHAPAYGEDPYTREASDRLRDFFETDCEIFFTFNGTAANSLALASLCRSYHSVLCSEVAHVETDECGAPEFFSNGTKILLVPGARGKVDPDAAEEIITKRTDIHYPKPRVISVTQPTEVGTVYTVAELQRLREVVAKYQLRFHMDGARFAHAVSTLKCRPREITWEAGVDVLCLGGSKIGLPVGDAVVFFDKALAEEFDFRCKQAGQLASKMRFLAAPWVGILKDGAMLRHAAHGNDMAQRLASGMREIGLDIAQPTEANGVFVGLSPELDKGLHDRGWQFYNFIGGKKARFMCAWDTQPEDVEALLGDCREILAQ